MRTVVTGTPGTGKTTAVERIESDVTVVHLNDVIREAKLYTDVDEERDSLVADLSAVQDWLEEYTETDDEDVLVESHLAHHLPANDVIVLRCHPEELERRLRERGEPDSKVEENAESEALDVILSQAVGVHNRNAVYEIDTTDRTPDEVAAAIDDVLRGEREPAVGTVSFIDYL